MPTFNISTTVYIVIFAVIYFRKFRESDPRENFHFSLCLFIVMKTSEKSRISALVQNRENNGVYSMNGQPI